jgi:hypothetical protein
VCARWQTTIENSDLLEGTMHRNRVLIVLVTAALVTGCGSDESGGATTTSEVVVTTTQPAATTTTQPVVTTTLPEPARPAIWPAADVVFDTPEAAAADFLAKVFGDGPVLGEFRLGDSRSGEIEVFASAEGVPLTVARSVLLLRQLGPSDGWFVLAAANDHATVTVPDSGTVVPAGPLTIEGVARGFEATIVVSAFVAGRADVEFGREVTMAGNFDVALPYSVVLDLTDASPGDTMVLLVRGGTGLETDPGDFGAIAVVVGN